MRYRATYQDRRHDRVDQPQALVREVEPPSLRLPQRPPRVLLLDQAPRPQRELEPRDEPEQRRDNGEDCAREKDPRETPGFSHVSRGPIWSGLGSTLGRLSLVLP